MSQGYIKQINFTDTKELMDFLDPESGELGNRYSWLFRGQSDSTWNLQSSLARHILFNKYNDRYTQDHFFFQEKKLLDEFKMSSAQLGLELPAKSDFDINEIYDDTPLNQEIHFLALAQHYGMPTRLLDWTFDRWNALYFALDLDNHLQRSKNSYMSLWCLNKDWLHVGIEYELDGEEYKLKQYLPTFHQNKHANAQKGLFTFIISKAYDIDAKWGNILHASEPLSKIPIKHLDLKYVIENAEFPFSGDKHLFALQLNIPRKLVEEIRGILWNRFISHSDLFPDYHGICRRIMLDEKFMRRSAFLARNKKLVNRRKIKK